ncbi:MULTISPECIES: guanylate kinase [Olsenella]|uniref:guanylate kinase n=1 Tax=Olsenella TaxID=133925 RepID=UPI000231F201|nr:MULTISPECIES: guanylate kinase [Olsenella]EHF01879.1 guanylate kinase [Olsenella sp. oral taxon 809 str. F0356]
MPRTPRLFVISGPSGAGKGTLLSQVLRQRPDLGLTVSATTRNPRPGEVDGVSYHFLGEDEFSRLVAEGAFLEWANVHGHRYGTLRSEVDDRLARGSSVVLEIDPQGAFNVRRIYPDAVLVFIEPPSMELLEQRLRARGTEDEASIGLRLSNARLEMTRAHEYDARVVNDELEAAAARLADTIDSFEKNGGNSQDGSD